MLCFPPITMLKGSNMFLVQQSKKRAEATDSSCGNLPTQAFQLRKKVTNDRYVLLEANLNTKTAQKMN